FIEPQRLAADAAALDDFTDSHGVTVNPAPWGRVKQRNQATPAVYRIAQPVINPPLRPYLPGALGQVPRQLHARHNLDVRRLIRNSRRIRMTAFHRFSTLIAITSIRNPP